jgi:hypothetical protein
MWLLGFELRTLEEQSALLTTEPSHQPPVLTFKSLLLMRPGGVCFQSQHLEGRDRCVSLLRDQPGLHRGFQANQTEPISARKVHHWSDCPWPHPGIPSAQTLPLGFLKAHTCTLDTLPRDSDTNGVFLFPFFPFLILDDTPPPTILWLPLEAGSIRGKLLHLVLITCQWTRPCFSEH